MMEERISRKAGALILAACLAVGLTACVGMDGGPSGDPVSGLEPSSDALSADPVFRVGLCALVDDAPQDRIAEGIRSRLDEIGAERDVVFEVSYADCGGDAGALDQIAADLISEDVDLLVGVTAPTATAILDAAGERGIPVIFAAVPDPEGAGLAASDDAPGGISTGTSDRLDTAAVMELIFAADPEASRIGILYDPGQSGSSASVTEAVAWLTDHGVEIVERSGSTEDEMVLAARALVGDAVDAVFTPIDDTVLRAEPSISGIFREAGIPHYAGADAFALQGAFLGHGVDYAELGAVTADMAAEVLLDGADPAALPVRALTGSDASVNAETCEALGWDLDTILAVFDPLCSRVETIGADAADLQDG